jgi:hypothetical protein
VGPSTRPASRHPGAAPHAHGVTLLALEVRCSRRSRRMRTKGRSRSSGCGSIHRQRSSSIQGLDSLWRCRGSRPYGGGWGTIGGRTSNIRCCTAARHEALQRVSAGGCLGGRGRSVAVGTAWPGGREPALAPQAKIAPVDSVGAGRGILAAVPWCQGASEEYRPGLARVRFGADGADGLRLDVP